MNRNSNVRFVKPMLEKLEERDLPSVLFPTNSVAQLAVPLTNMLADLNQAKTDLATQVAALPANGTLLTNNPGPIAQTFAKAAADFQRVLNDQHSIAATSTADITFLTAVAQSELMAGDSTDFILLNFGALFGFNATASLTTPVGQANQAVNDPTVQTEVTADHAFTVIIGAIAPGIPVVGGTDFGTIASATTTPSF